MNTYESNDSEKLQSGPSGRGTLFVDIKLEALPEYKFLILKSSSYFNVGKLILDQIDHLVPMRSLAIKLLATAKYHLVSRSSCRITPYPG